METIVSELQAMILKLKELGINEVPKLKEMVASYLAFGRKHNLSKVEYNVDYIERNELKMLDLPAKKSTKADRFKDAVREFENILKDQIQLLESAH